VEDRRNYRPLRTLWTLRPEKDGGELLSVRAKTSG